MPYDPLADGAELEAAHMLANFYNQVIAQVTSATRPPGTEGQVIYETDTDLYQAYTGAGWSVIGGLGPGTAWTPTINQGGSITKTITHSTYLKRGRLITLFMNVTLTAGGTGSNVVITVTGLPFNQAHSSGMYGGGGAIMYDSSTTTVYPYMTVVASATEIKFAQTDSAHTVNVFLGMSGSTFGGQLASGDSLQLVHTYEATG